jgi:hypothetical protein
VGWGIEMLLEGLLTAKRSIAFVAFVAIVALVALVALVQQSVCRGIEMLVDVAEILW